MESRTRPDPRRPESMVVLSVGGLSVLTGALYVWATHTLLASGAVTEVPFAALVGFVVVNAAVTVLLWWHRRCPVRVFLALLFVFVVSSILVGEAGNGGLTLPLWFGVYALVAYAPLRTALWIVAAGWIIHTAVKIGLVFAAGYPVTAPEVALTFAADVGFFYLASTAVGFVVRTQRQRLAETAERARLVEAGARSLHAEAVATERNRLARDLHDLAAHELMDVLLSVRALQVSSDDPLLSEIDEKTSRALDNMRAVVRTLRHDDERDSPDRLALTEAVEHRIQTLRDERGLSVESSVHISSAVDDAVTSTVLSVLTECLINASRHAPGQPVTVRLDEHDHGLVLTVRNPTTVSEGSLVQPGTGYGLIGAAERAALLDGAFTAGGTDDGWTATLRLPQHANETSEVAR